MGCSASETQKKQSSGMIMPSKTPVLVFYLPGNAKEDFSRMISSYYNDKPNEKKITIRYIDTMCQRSYRKFWPKELTSKTDRAFALYIADLRDRPLFFMNLKTLNWFVKIAGQSTLVIVLICKDEAQLQEFNENTSFKEVEIIPIYENKPESVNYFYQALSVYSVRYFETRKSGATSPKSPKTFRLENEKMRKLSP